MKATKKDAKGLELIADALEIASDYLMMDEAPFFGNDLDLVSASSWLGDEAARLRNKAKKKRRLEKAL